MRRNSDLDHTVAVFGRDTFLPDGSRSNQSIIEATRGACMHDRRGPVTVMRQPGTAVDPLVYLDMTLGDFRVAVDHFVKYSDESVSDPDVGGSDSRRAIKGVKITSIGDQREFGDDEFTAVLVPKSDTVVLGFHGRPRIPRRLGPANIGTKVFHGPKVEN